MPKINFGEFWEQQLRLEVRTAFPKLTVFKTKSNFTLLRDKSNDKTVTRTLPIEWKEENSKSIVEYLAKYTGKDLPDKYQQQRISVTCLTGKDYQNVRTLAYKWGCSEPKLVAIALHDWFQQIEKDQPTLLSSDP